MKMTNPESRMTTERRWLRAVLCAGLLPLAALGEEEEAAATAPAPVASEPADDAPLAFPPLEHYAPLWEASLFTTKSLPPPDDAPKGPIFTDNLALAGVYEVDGAVVGVVIDKTTSNIMEVRIGVENEAGIKIARINPGSTPDKTRVQLQKGEVAGWVTFSDAAPVSAENQSPVPAPGGPMPNQPPGSAIPGRPVVPRVPSAPVSQPDAPSQAPAPQAAPPIVPQSVPQPAPPPINNSPVTPAGDDVPLPPQ